MNTNDNARTGAGRPVKKISLQAGDQFAAVEHHDDGGWTSYLITVETVTRKRISLKFIPEFGGESYTMSLTK